MNSKAEFNRCHIPRLIVEEEDEDVKKDRKEKELKMDEEMARILEDMDMSWEEKKSKQRELAKKKRRRKSQEQEENTEESTRRKPKRIRCAIMEDDWGLGEDQGRMEEDSSVHDSSNVIVSPTPPPGRIMEHITSSRRLKTTSITDFFQKTTHVTRRMDSGDEGWMYDSLLATESKEDVHQVGKEDDYKGRDESKGEQDTVCGEDDLEDLFSYTGTQEDEDELWSQHLAYNTSPKTRETEDDDFEDLFNYIGTQEEEDDSWDCLHILVPCNQPSYHHCH